MPVIPPRHHAVRVPATTANLGPGFDAFGLALTTYLAVRSVPRSTQAERVATGDGELPSGDDNLVWRSLVSFCEAHGVAVPDVALDASNEVPVARGLGSSSAAIVAGLVLGRALTGVAVGEVALAQLATELEGHPDNVAPALMGGLVACATDDAGALTVRRINPAPALRPLALVPASRQDTTAARAMLPDAMPRADVAIQAARAGHVLGALIGAFPVAPELAGDLLHEPPRLAAMGASGEVLRALRQAGLHAWLSGAGPSITAVVPRVGGQPVPIARGIADGHDFRLHELEFDLAGAVCCPEGGCGLAGSGGCVRCPWQRV